MIIMTEKLKNVPKMLAALLLISLLLTGCTNAYAAPAAPVLPDGFVYVTDVVPDVILEIRYYGTYNFLGVRVDDYMSPVAIITEKAAAALKQADENLREQGYVIKVFDAYRPQGAVDHFVRWAEDENDI